VPWQSFAVAAGKARRVEKGPRLIAKNSLPCEGVGTNMNRASCWIVSLALVSSLTLACKSDKPAEGPAERAGKKVDKAAEDTKQEGKKAVDSTKEAADDAKKDVDKKTDKK
jgi:hypothetical protein